LRVDVNAFLVLISDGKSVCCRDGLLSEVKGLEIFASMAVSAINKTKEASLSGVGI